MKGSRLMSLRWKSTLGIVGIVTLAMGVATWMSVRSLHMAYLRGAQIQAEAFGRPMVLRAQELLGYHADLSMLKVLASLT